MMLTLLWLSLVCGSTLSSSFVAAVPSGIKKTFKVSGTGSVEGNTTLLELHLEADQPAQKTDTLEKININLSDKAVQLNGTHAQKLPFNNITQSIVQQKVPPVGLTAFEDEIVGRHNHYRQIHTSPPLKYNQELAASAKLHANRMAMSGALIHENQTILKARNQGENLGSRCSYLPLNNDREERKSIRKIVKKWYNEVCQFNFDTPSFQRNIGHFSQLDWSDSTDIGVGVAFSKNKKGMNCMYVVGRYSPAGNVATSKEFQRNVHLGQFQRMSYCRPQVLDDENV